MSETLQCWLYLALAIGLEVAGTTAMKASDGLSRLLPSVLIFVFYGLAFVFLALALKQIDVSVAYAIWAGVGTALIVLIGAVWFDEALTPLRIACIGLIVAGVVGLNLASQSG